ncbi:MAG: MbnP family protein [Bacteroidota bacterium]
MVPSHPGASAGTTIRFRHLVGNRELKLFDKNYTNRFGESFIVTKFKYYISGLSVTDAGGRTIRLKDSCYLVDEQDSLSKIIQLPACGRPQSISFFIGIDSAKNTDGVQTGSLDPANGMFWTWNSGYIFVRLEGQSNVSPAPAHIFGWDIGGFRYNENALRKITLTVNKYEAFAGNTIVIDADILTCFDGVHPLQISGSPVCHQPGKLAMQLADNCSTMFSVAP